MLVKLKNKDNYMGQALQKYFSKQFKSDSSDGQQPTRVNAHSTGSPHYLRSFYLPFGVYAIQKWPLFWNLSSDLQ